MLLLLTLLLQWRVTTCTSSPTIEDNNIGPTDEQQLITDLINSYRGQPEQEIALNLPTDEEAFNEIKPILQSAAPFYYTNKFGHFMSSFPEIDSRGFHESVFDDLDDFYPISQRGKKYDSAFALNARGFHGDDFTNGFGTFRPVKRNDEFQYFRGKRSVPVPNEAASVDKPTPIESSSTTSNSKSTQLCTPQICIDTVNESNQIVRQLRNSSTSVVKSIQSVPAAGKAEKPLRYKRDVFIDSGQKRKAEMDATGFEGDVFRNFGTFEPVRKRKPEMDSNGFSGDVFNGDFGANFDPMEKRVPEIDKAGFHNNVFHNNFGNFDTLKRSPKSPDSDFASDVFHQSFGNFNTLKRAPEMGQTGFHNDVFHKDFGNFVTLRKRKPQVEGKNFNNDAFNRDFGHFDTLRKRKIENNLLQTHRTLDWFDRDFGNFFPGKRRGNSGAVNGDAFHSNFGIFETLKKRRPEAGELTGDAFHRGFGNFNTMKRTLTGDAFHSQFGKFETMKRKPEMDANGFDGDVFHGQFQNFETLKRTPVLSSDDFFELSKERPHRFDRLRLKEPKKPLSFSEFYKLLQYLRSLDSINRMDIAPLKVSKNQNESPIRSRSSTQLKNLTIH